MSPSQGPRKPIKKISLKVGAEDDPDRLTALKEKLANARVVKGSLTETLVTTKPEEAIEELRRVGDALRNPSKRPEGFK